MTNTTEITAVIETETFEASEVTSTVETVEVETFAPGQSNVENMLDTLPYMGKGMLGILIVTVIIIVSVVILNKVTNRKKKD